MFKYYVISENNNINIDALKTINDILINYKEIDKEEKELLKKEYEDIFNLNEKIKLKKEKELKEKKKNKDSETSTFEKYIEKRDIDSNDENKRINNNIINNNKKYIIIPLKEQESKPLKNKENNSNLEINNSKLDKEDIILDFNNNKEISKIKIDNYQEEQSNEKFEINIKAEQNSLKKEEKREKTCLEKICELFS